MAKLARLSHTGFNVPRELFDRECEFWEKIVGLTLVRKGERNAFFTSDPLRDHEFIIYAVDGPVVGFGGEGCILNHLAFDVATDAEVAEFTERFRAHGFDVEEPARDRRQKGRASR